LPAPCRELVQWLRATLAGRQPAFVTDWTTLLQQATGHGVDAFLYPALATLPANRQPPPAVRARWRQQSLSAAAAAVHREAQTRELLSALAEARVCSVPLKGAWLAAKVYPEPGQRAMDDIDVLVPPAELARAQEVLGRLGYTPHGNTASLELDCDQVYTCPRHAWPLELHWNLGVAGGPPLHRPEVPGLWRRLVPDTLLDAPVRALCPEEHLVYLTYHVLHHRFLLPLRGYVDLVLLGRLAGDSARRATLQTIAAEWGLTHALPRVLAIACELFDQPPPGALAGWMPDAREGPQCEQAVRTILRSYAQRALPAEQTLLAFQARPPLARVGLLLSRIFMPRAFLRRKYACARWRLGLPLAYFLRARDLLRRNAGSIRQTLQHDPALAQQLDLAAARKQLLHWTLAGRDAASVAR
jgi:hypothetical protein